MKKQGYNDRLDERLAEIDGPERDKEQSYDDRRKESRAMKKYWEAKKEMDDDKSYRHSRHHFKDEEEMSTDGRVKDIPFDDLIFNKKS